MKFLSIHNFPKIKLILKFIYKKTLRKLFVKIIAPLIQKKSETFISEIIKKIKNPQKKIIFYYQEYETIDTVSIYQGLKHGLIKRGYQVSDLEFKLFPIGNFINNKLLVKNKNSNFENSLIRLKKQCKKFNQIDLFYALVDTIHKHHYQIWKNSFNGSFVLQDKFFEKIKKFQKKISKLADKNDGIFFPDSPYIYNQILKQEFLKKKKKAFVLSSSAGFHESKTIYASEISEEKSKNNILLYKKNKKKIDKYIIERFKGKFAEDYNNLSFENLDFKKNINNNTKVLFLHSFTDSGNNTWSTRQPFASHLEWTEYTLRELSKINFKDWFIKIHPVSQVAFSIDPAYQNQAFGNNQIIKYLKTKYKIPTKIFSECPNTIEILTKKVPVYTNQSTVIHETIIYGYKSFFTGPRFDQYFGNKIFTKQDWKKALFKKNVKSKNLIPKKLVMESKFKLWKAKTKYETSSFLPDDYLFSWDGNYKSFKLGFKFLIKMMFSKNNDS